MQACICVKAGDWAYALNCSEFIGKLRPVLHDIAEMLDNRVLHSAGEVIFPGYVILEYIM